jgi:DNA-binding NarL/FixJ family response regulator
MLPSKEQDYNLENEIDSLVLLGNSETIHYVSNAITSNIAEFKHIYHIDKFEGFKNLFDRGAFATIIIDHDDKDIDVITTSNLIHMSRPQIRILLATHNLTIDLLKSIINYTPIKDVIQVPTDSYIIYQKIIEQQTKFSILKLIADSLNNPPKFSPAFYRLNREQENLKSEIIGASITINSLVQFSFIDETSVGINKNLLGLFMSAISGISDEFHPVSDKLQELKIGNFYILYYFRNNVQYSFFVRYYVPSKQNEISTILELMIKDFETKIIEPLDNNFVITTELDQLFVDIIKSTVPKIDYYELPMIENPRLIIHKLSNGRFHNYINDISLDFQVVKATTEDEVIDHLYEEKMDLLMISSYNQLDDRTDVLAQIVKEYDPTIQVILIVENPTIEKLLELINEGIVDFIIFANDSHIKFLSVMQQSRSKFISSKREENTLTKQNLDWITSREDFVKSIYRKQEILRAYSQLKTPIIYSIYIYQNNKLFFQKLWEDNADITYLDPHKFNHIVMSLKNFNREIDKLPEPTLGIRFGNTQIVIREIFEYIMVFIVGNIDEFNIYFLNEALDITVASIVEELCAYHNSSHKDLIMLVNIEQMLIELYMKCASLSL